jgi:hypothetical protein
MTADHDRSDPAIDLARLDSRIALDRNGTWHHEGVPVTHERLERALHSWVDRDDETGKYVLRAGEQWCFIEVEDTPLFVRGVVLTGEPDDIAVTLRLSDGREEELDYSTLRQTPDNVLYCDARQGRMPARFDRVAYYRLAEHVELDDDEPVLPARGRRWPVRQVTRR